MYVPANNCSWVVKYILLLPYAQYVLIPLGIQFGSLVWHNMVLSSCTSPSSLNISWNISQTTAHHVTTLIPTLPPPMYMFDQTWTLEICELMWKAEAPVNSDHVCLISWTSKSYTLLPPTPPLPNTLLSFSWGISMSHRNDLSGLYLTESLTKAWGISYLRFLLFCMYSATHLVVQQTSQQTS